MQNKFMTLDETGISQIRAEDKAFRKRELQQLSNSPIRQKLEQSPPNAVRFAYESRAPRPKSPSKTKSLSKSRSPEVTQVERVQAQTEMLLKQRLEEQAKQTQRPVTPPSDQSSSEAEEPPASFNPNTYIMRPAQSDGRQELFQQHFNSFMKANKKQINKKLVELIHLQVEETIQEKYEMQIPAVLKGNIQHWSNLLVKSKRLQGVLADFNDQVAEALDYEISHQKSFIKEYLMAPRLPGEKGFSSTMVIPKEPSTKQQLSFFKRAKAEIRDMSIAVRRTEIKRRLTIQDVQREEERIRNKLLQAIKNRQKEENKPLLLPVQELLLEKIASLANHAEQIEENNNDLNDEVIRAERDLIDTKNAKQGRNPGADIQRMLNRWKDDGSWFNETDLKNYANELWMTKEQFEQELHEQQTAMAIELRERKAAYVARVDSIRSNTSFQIQALESALIETKIKAAREVERAQMQLAEMESHYLNKQQEQKFVENALKDAESLLEPQPGKPRLTPEEENKTLKKALKHLLQTVESQNTEQKAMKQQNTELQGVIERDKAFNAKAQSDFKRTKEMTIYYQMIIHDIIKRMNVFESQYASREEKVLFKEILDLNEQREKKDQDEIDRNMADDPKRALQRLGAYVDDLHKIFVQLDFKRVFDHYTQVNLEKEKIVKALAHELNDIGLISEKHFDRKTDALKITDLVKEADLEVVDKKTMDPSWQRMAPKRKNQILWYEDLRNYQPIGIVRPERKQAVHTFLEQLLLPNQERLHFILQQENEARLERERQQAKEDQAKLLKEQEAAALKQLEKEGGLMESQHFEMAKQFKASPNSKETKKMVDQFSKNQTQRVQEKERKEKAKAKELAEKLAAEQAEVKKQAALKAAQEAAEAKAAAAAKKAEETKADLKAGKKGGKAAKGKQTKTESKKEIVVTVDEVPPPLSRPMSRNITTTLIGELETKTDGMLNHIEEAMNLVEDKVNAKYESVLKKLEGLDKASFELANKDFQVLYETLTQSLGQDIASKDYNTMFTATNIESFIENANTMQAKYLRKDKPPKDSKTKVEFQVSDLLMPEIDSSGEFKGFKIRTNLAKALFVQNKDAASLANVVKTSTMLNRVIHDQTNDLFKTKKETKPAKTAQVQCDLMQEVVKIVEKQVFVEVPVPVQATTNAVTPGPSASQSESVAQFFELVRNHAITVLMRENPERAGYYKLVWKNQRPEELLAYKLDNVFKEVPEDGLDEDDQDEKMNVAEYFDFLFKELAEKLLMNVPRDEKKELDVKKWIWNGNIYDEPKVVEVSAAKAPSGSTACQTPAEWFSKTKLKNESEHYLDFKDNKGLNRTSMSKSKFETVPKNQSPKGAMTKNFGVQTGEELLEAFMKAQEENMGVTTRLQEQIDEIMGQEISKTIESMQQFINMAKILPKKTEKDPVDEKSPPRDRLKKRLKGLRNDLSEGASNLRSDIEKLSDARRIKKLIQFNEKSARNTPIDFGPSESQQHVKREKLPHITFPDFPPDVTMDRLSKFETKHSPRVFSQISSAKNATHFGNPFKQMNQQSSHFDSARTSHPNLLARATSDSMPQHVIRVRLQIANPDASTNQDTTPELLQSVVERSKRGSFFTGMNTELNQGPVRGEIKQNATATSFLSPKRGFISKKDNLTNFRPTLYLNDNLSLTQTDGFAQNKDLPNFKQAERSLRNFTPLNRQMPLNRSSLENE